MSQTLNEALLNQEIKESLGQIYPVEDVYCRVGELQVHYQVSGSLDKPPLIMIHGIGGRLNWWRANLPTFSKFYRTYALDLPGFGRSKRLPGRFTINRGAEFVKNWLDLVGLKKVHLVAHSMGGQIAARLAANHPEMLDKLVLVAPNGLPLSFKVWKSYVSKVPKVKVPLNQTISIAVGTMRTDMLALGQSIYAVFNDPEVEETLRKVVTPTLVVWGTADSVLPPQLGQRTLALLPNARLALIENGTHSLMFDQSYIFNREVLTFLRAEH
jgi:pimeloyl-ACP methyl ester carboxylesterase